MNCSPGQVDLNHASLAQLQTLPDVSGEIAQRVVATRPHDRVRDLLVVSGIGPGKLTRIESTGNACSTPLTLPPPAADVCTTSSQLDVNDPASQAGLAQLFGTPTAQRIIGAQPFPDLAHAKIVLAAGAGPGKVTKYASRLCLTPEPKISRGVNYSWVYSSKGGRADYSGFSLVVPAGTLTAPIGQWLRLTPRETPTTDLPGPAWPSADFSVLGTDWTDGSKRVYVTLPTDPALPELFGDRAIPVVAHWSDADRTSGELASETRVDPDAATITAAVTHLSTLDSILQGISQEASKGISWAFEPIAGLLADARFPAPDCNGSWTINEDTGDWNAGTARVHLTSAFLNLPDGIVPPFGWPIKHCVEGAANEAARLKLRNNTRTFETLTHYNADNVALGNVGLGGSPFTLIIAKAAELYLGTPVAYPGGDVTATIASGDQGSVQMRPNAALTAVWAVLDQTPIKEWVDQFGRLTPLESVFRQDFACLLSQLGTAQAITGSAANIANALTSAVRNCFDFESIRVAAVKAMNDGLISPEQLGKAGALLNRLQRYILWLKVGQITVSGYDSIFANAGGPSAGIINIEHYRKKPTVDSQGRPVHAPCLRLVGYIWRINDNCQNGYYTQITRPPSGSGGGDTGFPAGKIARDSQGRSWLINLETRTMHPIENGNTYLCLAKHYAVDWDAYIGDYRAAFGADREAATCDSSLPDTRPINQGQTGPDAIVLRQPDRTAWVVWNGSRIHIPSGGEFQCWVNPHYAANIEFDVWDQVTDAQLATIPETTSFFVSNCGDPENPEF